MKYSKDTIMEKHSYGNSLIRDFYLKKEKNCTTKKPPIKIYTHTCFLLDQMNIKHSFKKAKYLTCYAIYKITVT